MLMYLTKHLSPSLTCLSTIGFQLLTNKLPQPLIAHCLRPPPYHLPHAQPSTPMWSPPWTSTQLSLTHNWRTKGRSGGSSKITLRWSVYLLLCFFSPSCGCFFLPAVTTSPLKFQLYQQKVSYGIRYIHITSDLMKNNSLTLAFWKLVKRVWVGKN